MARTRLTFRRISGLDRSGEPPPETLKGAPLRPWTIPNLIGFTRIALIPVFALVSLQDDDGVTTTGAILFAVIAWTDYADGIAARLTGQYSRLGALMDPLTDRLLVLAGAIVCWNFELLPRWEIAIVATRELAMIVLVRLALKRGAEMGINWPGRLSVWPLMSAVFFAIAGVPEIAEPSLHIGVVLMLWATALYVRDGLRQVSTRG